MNKHRGNSLFSLLLLLLFIFCSFFIILVQIKGYQDIMKENNKIREVHTPYAYLSNKIRSFDKVNQIAIMNIEGNDCLKLESENGDLWIYEYQGSIKELYNIKNREFNPNEGEKLFTVDKLSIQKEENKLHFTLKVKKQEENFTIQLRSGE